MRNHVCIAAALAWPLHAAAAEPPARAAQSDFIELYGSIDLSYVHDTGVPAERDAGARTVWGLASGQGAASSLGVRGAHSLGSGVRVEFVAETGFCAAGIAQLGIDADDPSQQYCSGAGWMQRESHLGLSTRVGTFSAGLHPTLLAVREGEVDAFEDAYAGAVGNISLISNNRPGIGLSRVAQSLAYTSPPLRGVTLSAQYAFNVGRFAQPRWADAPTPRAWLLDVERQAGALVAGLTHAQYQNFRYALPGDPQHVRGGYRIWMGYARYDFGRVRADAIVQRNTADDSSGEQTVWSLGLVLPHGAARWMASVGQHASSMAPLPQQLATSRAWQYALGWRYGLSARTELHASFAWLRNAAADSTHAGTRLSPAPTGAVVGALAQGFECGITHRF